MVVGVGVGGGGGNSSLVVVSAAAVKLVFSVNFATVSYIVQLKISPAKPYPT